MYFEIVIEKTKFEVNSIDIAAIVSELANQLPRYASQIYRGLDGSYILRLTSKEDVRDLKIVPGKALFLAEGVFKQHGELDSLTITLRRTLRGFTLKSCEHVLGERIAILHFERGEIRYRLVAEVFPGGGLSLLDAGGNVVASTSLEKGRPYSPPQARRTVTSGEELLRVLSVIERKSRIGVVLARELGLGGKYSDEVLARAGVEPSKRVGELAEWERAAIAESLDKVLRLASVPEPRLYRSGDQYVAFAPFPLKHLAEKGLLEEFETSINRAAMRVYESYLRGARLVEHQRKILEEAKKIEKEIAEKKALAEQLRTKASELREVADLLFSKISELKDSWLEIREGRRLEGLVMSIDSVAGTATLLIEGREVKLSIREPVTRQIDELYQSSKTTMKGAENLMSEISELERRLSSLRESPPPTALEEVVERRSRGAEWYQRYRWSLTAGGHLIVLGRDTSSNIRLLKRHLESPDLVFHAEVRGSPVAILKEGAEAGQDDLRAAATLCASFSRAWREEVSSTTVYWVKPDQISFSPPQGTYLPKGSFIVKPPKNYIAVKLEICVGYSRRLGPIVGCEEWVSREADVYAVITPGKEAASTLSRTLIEIAERSIGVARGEIKPYQLEAIVPYGRCRVLRWSHRGHA
ncbi:MAG: NFACT family protein [Nitrososphaerota archaeon]